MQNLKYIKCTEIERYDRIVDSKSSIIRQALKIIRPKILSDYNNYNRNFKNIPQITQSVYISPHNNYLRHCYTSKTKARDLLLKDIIEAQSDEFQSICAYCLYHKRTEIDHYIPKEEYCEFSVLASNLLPICSKCNKKKNELWRKKGERIFIHFYKDHIPPIQFLFGDLTIINDKPMITFQIRKPKSISISEFSLIKSHFDELELCDLYQKGVPSLASTIKSTIVGIRKSIGQPIKLADAKNILNNIAEEDAKKYGVNYWESISKKILANSPSFLANL